MARLQLADLLHNALRRRNLMRPMDPTMADLADTEIAQSPNVDFEPGHSRLVALPLLLPSSVVTVRTRNSCYRMVVVDCAARRVLITGGWVFRDTTEAEVIGARDDDGVKVGWIVEGLQLQLSTPQGPVITSTVESVSVDGDGSFLGAGDSTSDRDIPF